MSSLVQDCEYRARVHAAEILLTTSIGLERRGVNWTDSGSNGDILRVVQEWYKLTAYIFSDEAHSYILHHLQKDGNVNDIHSIESY